MSTLRRKFLKENLDIPPDKADYLPDPEDTLLQDLGGMYSDMYKELYGRRPRIPMFKTVDEANAAVEEIWEEYAAVNRAREEQERQDLEFIEMERRMQEMMPGEYDYEHVPKRSGMGRRTEGVVRLSETKLRKIISIIVEGHIDGHPFPGSLEELADFHSKFWGHGSVVNPSDWKQNIKLGGQFTVGKAPGILRKSRNLKETLRHIVKKHV
jgi:polyhydroxyalkanoate synthesis regulator phasin